MTMERKPRLRVQYAGGFWSEWASVDNLRDVLPVGVECLAVEVSEIMTREEYMRRFRQDVS